MYGVAWGQLLILAFLCTRVLAAYVKSHHHRVPSRSIPPCEFLVGPLARPALRSVLKTRTRRGLSDFPHVHLFEAFLPGTAWAHVQVGDTQFQKEWL